MAAKPAGAVLFALIANGKSVLVSKRLRDGNFVQYAKLIVASGLEQEGDHVRSYLDKSGGCACVYMCGVCVCALTACAASSSTRPSSRA